MADYRLYSDQELADLLKTGDAAAFTQIFHRYKEVLYRHAYNLLGDLDEAEDIVQDVFTLLWQKRSEIHLTGQLSSYLYTSVRNRVFNFISHRQVAARYQQSISQFISEGVFTTDEQVRAKELARLIEQEIDALPPRMREVFLLSREEGLTHKEIAERLRISDKTAKLQVAKALKILKIRIHGLLPLIISLL